MEVVYRMDSLVLQRPWPWQSAQGFPWNGLQIFSGPEPLHLDSGETLPAWHLAYEEWGPVDGQPVVIFHALTGDSHVAEHPTGGPAGWWSGVVGPGRGLDTERWHVLSFNVLGGAMGSTGPSSRDEEGNPWGSRFPRLSLFDMARAAHALVHRWHAGPVHLVGGSMGGMLAFAYAALYRAEVQSVMAIGAPLQHNPWAIAYHQVGRQAIHNDPAFLGGNYYGGPGPRSGLAIARMADMISYQHPDSMNLKFGRGLQEPDQKEFQIASYLRYQGEKLVRRFDANTYLVLTEAMDSFAMEPRHIEPLRGLPIWMLGIESDLLYMPEEIQRAHASLQATGIEVRLEWLKGPWGHDTFLVEQDQTSEWVREFLNTVSET